MTKKEDKELAVLEDLQKATSDQAASLTELAVSQSALASRIANYQPEDLSEYQTVAEQIEANAVAIHNAAQALNSIGQAVPAPATTEPDPDANQSQAATPQAPGTLAAAASDDPNVTAQSIGEPVPGT